MPSSCSRRLSVSAPTPRCFLISRWTASPVARTGCSLRSVSARRLSRPGRREEPAHCDLDHIVDLAQRQHLLLQQNARGKTPEEPAVRLDIFERRVAEAVFRGEPLEHLLFLGVRARLAGGAQAFERLGIHRRELLALHHRREQRRALLVSRGNSEESRSRAAIGSTRDARWAPVDAEEQFGVGKSGPSVVGPAARREALSVRPAPSRPISPQGWQGGCGNVGSPSAGVPEDSSLARW